MFQKLGQTSVQISEGLLDLEDAGLELRQLSREVTAASRRSDNAEHTVITAVGEMRATARDVLGAVHDTKAAVALSAQDTEAGIELVRQTMRLHSELTDCVAELTQAVQRMADIPEAPTEWPFAAQRTVLCLETPSGLTAIVS